MITINCDPCLLQYVAFKSHVIKIRSHQKAYVICGSTHTALPAWLLLALLCMQLRSRVNTTYSHVLAIFQGLVWVVALHLSKPFFFIWFWFLVKPCSVFNFPIHVLVCSVQALESKDAYHKFNIPKGQDRYERVVGYSSRHHTCIANPRGGFPKQ